MAENLYQQKADIRTSSIQEAVRSMDPLTSTAGMLQQVAGKATQQAGKEAAQTTGQIFQRDIQKQQANAEVQSKQASLGLRERQMNLQIIERKNAEAVANLQLELGRQSFDDSMKFREDEMGRKSLNARQLVDFAVLKARNEADFSQFQQDVEQAWKRKELILRAAHAKIRQRLEQEFVKSEQEKDQTLMRTLQEQKRAMEEKIAKQKAEANKWGGIISGAGMILGGVIGGVAGSYAGNPAMGAMAGASIGQGLGQAGYNAYAD